MDGTGRSIGVQGSDAETTISDGPSHDIMVC